MKIYITLFIMSFVYWSNAEAQFYKPSNKTIRLGDTLPLSFFQTVHQVVNSKSSEVNTLQLKHYRNKLIILDFWATWCAPCIYSLKKLDSTQKVMRNDGFIIIPVTYQKSNDAVSFFSKTNLNLVSIVADTTLAKIFPHNGLPHQVWIKDGKVVAFPQWKYATAKNIYKGIRGEPLEMIMNIQDKKIEFDKPLKSSFDKEHEQILFQSLITGEITGAMKSPLVLKQTTSATTFTMINQSIKHLLFETYKNDISAELIANYEKGIIWEISDSLEKSLKEPKHLLNIDLEKDNALEKWQKNNLYSYQLFSTSKLDSNKAREIMQRDVNRYLSDRFNLEIKMGTKKRRVAILKILNTVEETMSLLKNKGENWKIETTNSYYSMKGVGFRAILGLLSTISPGSLPINKANISSQFEINFTIPKTIDNNPLVAKKELAKYGLELIIDEIDIPVLYVREGNAKR